LAQRLKIEKECEAHCGTDPGAKARFRHQGAFEVVDLDPSVDKGQLMSRHKVVHLLKNQGKIDHQKEEQAILSHRTNQSKGSIDEDESSVY